MVQLGPLLKEFLEADANVYASVQDRIYPVFGPQEPTLPIVTFTIDYRFEHTLDNAKVQRASVQVHCWSYDYDEAHSVADKIGDRLHGFSGPLGSEGVDIRHCLLEERSDDVGEITGDEVVFVTSSIFDVMFD